MLKNLVPKKIKNKLDDYIYKRVLRKLRNTECIYKINIQDVKKLEGKIAIVTGGSGAIGSAICFRLAAEGAIVGVCGRSKEKIDPIIKQIDTNKNSGGGIGIPLLLDVTDENQIETVFDSFAKKYGKIDILVNNAGGSSRQCKDLVSQEISVIDMVLNTNLRGSILCSKFASKYMIEQKYGKIVNIGSTVGIQGSGIDTEYSSAKSGILGMTKSLAKGLAKYNINVNCVTPGRINQIIFDKPLPYIKDKGSFFLRKGKTDEIASVVEFLVTDESSYITGQNIIVDGGRSLSLKGD